MGRVRTNLIKKASKQMIEKYYSRMTLDFSTNKRLLDEVAAVPSKRIRNKIAGFSTHLMKRVLKGAVRGISLRLQEEEREKRLDFVPDQSAIATDRVAVDEDTNNLMKSLNFGAMSGMEVSEHADQQQYPKRGGGGGRGRGGRRENGPRPGGPRRGDRKQKEETKTEEKKQ